VNKTRSCFEEFVNQLNLYYICICLYLQQDMSYVTHELDRRISFTGSSLAQWVVSENFIFFYVFNFSVVFFMSLWSAFILSKKTHHYIILNFLIQSRSILLDCQLVLIMMVNNLSFCLPHGVVCLFYFNIQKPRIVALPCSMSHPSRDWKSL
jgi:hypothetical protein